MKKFKPKFWQGSIKETDDMGNEIFDVFVDGRTISGRWAIMSMASHSLYGIGLGTGRGQIYCKQPDGQWANVTPFDGIFDCFELPIPINIPKTLKVVKINELGTRGEYCSGWKTERRAI